MHADGHTDVYHAQVVANDANLQMNRENNATQIQLAENANQWNWANLQAQNLWNIQQWERENAYNDPSAQMQRFMSAGINPIFAMGGIDAGNAQHLESGSPLPAEVAKTQAGHVEPAYDPYAMQRIGNIITAARDLVNASQGFRQLGINQQNADTSRAAQLSQSEVNNATVAEKKAATNAIEIETQWKTDTFGVRVEAEAAKLQNLRKSLEVMDSQSEMYKSTKNKLDAEQGLIKAKTDRIAEDYELRWKQLDVDRMRARAAMTSANAQQASVTLGQERLAFDRDMAQKTVEKWNNEQRLDFLRSFASDVKLKGEVSGSVGSDYLGAKLGGKVGAEGSSKVIPDEELLRELGYRAITDFANNPTEENAKVAKLASDTLNTYLEKADNAARGALLYRQSDDSQSVLNPSFDESKHIDPFIPIPFSY